MLDKLKIVFNEDSSQRLDKFLVGLQRQEFYSRTLIEKLIANGHITVNNSLVKKSYLLSYGDIVEVIMPELHPVDIKPQDIPLDVVYEDDYLAVINKPPGLVIHPGYGNPDKTLVNAIVFRFGATFPANKGSNRPGIVHRLDKGTSGLVIVAKDDKTQSILSDMFAKRQVKKTYLAITTGIPENSEGKVENYITRNKTNPRKMAVSSEGKLALTHYKVLRYYLCFALIEVSIESGRMHQIRVHFENLKQPILGDMLYNSISRIQATVPDNMKRKVHDLLSNHLKRQALHAWKISFIHPYLKQEQTFTAPLPEDFKYTLDWLEQYFAIDNVGYDKKMLND